MTPREAANKYLARRDRREHPAGRFDKAGRWYPADEETAPCCTVRHPSRAYPYSLMVHCRTAKHIAALAGVSVSELLAAAREVERGS